MPMGFPRRDWPRQPLALIVLNYERKALLLECLSAASVSHRSPRQIVVVDNCSNDGSADAVERHFPHVIVLRNQENRGVAGGRNVGAKWVLDHLDAGFLAFMDNDALLEPRTLGELCRRAGEDRGIGLVAPKAYRLADGRRLLSAGTLRFNPYTGSLRDRASGELDTGQFEEPRDIQACPGLAFLVRREVFDRIGFFDERLNPYGWEDVDFSLRARDAGYRVVYAPRAIVHHLGDRSGHGPVTAYEYHKARSMLYFVRRHTNYLQWICFWLVLPCRSLGRVAKELCLGRLGSVREWIRGLGAAGRRD